LKATDKSGVFQEADLQEKSEGGRVCMNKLKSGDITSKLHLVFEDREYSKATGQTA
jgi:hypothetical protein